MLQRDHESEVRIAAALRAAGVASALGKEYGASTIFPVVSKLVQDTNCASRRQLSIVLMDLAKPLGKEYALSLVYPVMLTHQHHTIMMLTHQHHTIRIK